MNTPSGIWIRAGIGVVVGAGIVAVDNFAFGGEVSPIVIVGMLLVFGAAAGMIWGVRAGGGNCNRLGLVANGAPVETHDASARHNSP